MRTACPKLLRGCDLIVVLAIVLFPRAGFAQLYDEIFPPALGPAVRIASPPNHAIFYSPADIPILAYARPEATFTNVEFYANGTNDLGSGVPLDLPGGPVTPALASPSWIEEDILVKLHHVWCLDWTNAPAGSFALTAVARGEYEELDPLRLTGIVSTSAPVNITIVSGTPSPNLPDIVNIVATDPIAIAGTNSSWIWKGTTNATPRWNNWPPTAWEWFTNWGPKSALFTVHRFGSADSALTVTYNIGGTASNGVDDFALPGSVDIPAGYSRALIPIVPIDHGTNSGPKTVILSLTTNAVSNYLVGIPPRAEVLILENWPLPVPRLLPDGSFHFNATGPDGAWFGVESSGDLQNWTSQATNQVIDGSIDFIDPPAPGYTARFYYENQVTNTPGN